MSNIREVEGIGSVFGEKLDAAGASTVEKLLSMGSSPNGRKSLADKTGLSSHLILGWVNRADLARIKGIGSEYADLLEASGVDTVPELAQRNAENLHTKMEEVNGEKNFVRRLPSAEEVVEWVEQAKDLDRVVTY